MPFSPIERHDDDGEPGRRLRRVRASATAASTTRAISTRRDRAAARFRSSRSSRRARAATTPTGTTSRRTSASPGGPNVESGWLRALLGDPAAGDDSRRLLGGVRTAGHRRLHRHLRTESRQHAEPDARRQHRPGRSRRDAGRCCCARPDRLYSGAVPGDADVPDSDPAESRRQHQRVPSGHRGGVGPLVDRRPAARDQHQDMALEVRYVGTRGVNQWSTLNYNERNVIENGFLDEFKLAMANLQANNARRRRPRRIVRVLRARHGHQSAADLSRLPEWPARRGQPGRLHRRRGDVDATRRSRAGSCTPIRIRTSSAPRP